MSLRWLARQGQRISGGMRRIMAERVAFILLELHLDEALEYFSAMKVRDVLALIENAGYHVVCVAGHRSNGTPALARAPRERGFRT